MDEPLRDRVRAICAQLPEVAEVIRNPLHSGFEVRGKTFCYYLNDHHGDGRLALTVKGMPGVQGMLVDMDASRFFVPPYMGRHGWVGVYLDVEPIDWEQAETLIREAYVSMAPKTLARLVTP
jgi:hypothetical protein